MGVLGLRFCARAFSSCSEWGPLLIVVRGPLTIAASLVAEQRLQTRRLSSCGSRAQLLRSMWDPPRPGPESVSPASAGRLSTTVPPGKPLRALLEKSFLSVTTITSFIWSHSWEPGAGSRAHTISQCEWIPSNWTSNGAESMFLEDQTGTCVAFNKIILPGQNRSLKMQTMCNLDPFHLLSKAAKCLLSSHFVQCCVFTHNTYFAPKIIQWLSGNRVINEENMEKLLAGGAAHD